MAGLNLPGTAPGTPPRSSTYIPTPEPLPTFTTAPAKKDEPRVGAYDDTVLTPSANGIGRRRDSSMARAGGGGAGAKAGRRLRRSRSGHDVGGSMSSGGSGGVVAVVGAGQGATGRRVPSRREGFLEKRMRRTRLWNKRYFICDNGSLSYYERPFDPNEMYRPKRKGMLDITGESVLVVDAEDGCIFSVSTSERIMELKAKSVEEASEWMATLRVHMSGAAPRKPAPKPSPGSAPSSFGSKKGTGTLRSRTGMITKGLVRQDSVRRAPTLDNDGDDDDEDTEISLAPQPRAVTSGAIGNHKRAAMVGNGNGLELPPKRPPRPKSGRSEAVAASARPVSGRPKVVLPDNFNTESPPKTRTARRPLPRVSHLQKGLRRTRQDSIAMILDRKTAEMDAETMAQMKRELHELDEILNSALSPENPAIALWDRALEAAADDDGDGISLEASSEAEELRAVNAELSSEVERLESENARLAAAEAALRATVDQRETSAAGRWVQFYDPKKRAVAYFALDTGDRRDRLDADMDVLSRTTTEVRLLEELLKAKKAQAALEAEVASLQSQIRSGR